MSVRASRNLAREGIEGAIDRVSDSIIRRVVESRRPLVVADALHDAEWSGSSSVVNLKLCSVMCAPLMQKGEVFGVIYLGNDNVVSLFDDRALEVLTVFAAQASLLVQNAMLLDSLRRENLSLREAVASRQYGEIIGSGASMREVYRRIEKVAATDISVLITGRDRDRQGAGGARDPPPLAAGRGRLRGRQLRRHPGERCSSASSSATSRAPSPAPSPTGSGKFEAAARRDAVPRRDRRHAPGAPGQAPARAAGAGAVTQGGRHPARAGGHPRHRRHQPRPGGRDQEGHASARTCTTGSTWCAIAPAAAARSRRRPGGHRPLLPPEVRARSSACRCAASRPARWWPCASTAGRATSASSRTGSRRRWCWPTGPWSRPRTWTSGPEILEPILPLAQAKEEFQTRYINEVLERNGGNRTKTAKDLGVDPRTIFRHLEKMEERLDPDRRSQPPPDTEETA